MNAPLYTTAILRLAASIPHLGRLELPMGRAELRSPTCGSTALVEVRRPGLAFDLDTPADLARWLELGDAA